MLSAINKLTTATPADLLQIFQPVAIAIKKEDPKEKQALAKLPANAVPRAHPSAAGLIPIWDLFQDDNSGLGVIVLTDGSYRCCFELDGVHVSGFDEVRLVSLMNHFTGLVNSIDTSVQLTVV